MTSRSDISRELELKLAEEEEKRENARRKKEARKFFRMQAYGSPGPGHDFPSPGSDPNVKHYKKRGKKNKKGGKIMVGYKAGGKV
tara:strand:- start:1050 stop:1304 length:255 start_codon:yes stop_codon:yes gene_type:complete